MSNVKAFSFSFSSMLPPVRQPVRLYLHAGGPGIHAGIEDSDEHSSAIVLGEPGEIRRGAGFFFGEQPVEGERFLGRVSSHDRRSVNENKAAKWGRETHTHGKRDKEESWLKGQCVRFIPHCHISPFNLHSTVLFM